MLKLFNKIPFYSPETPTGTASTGKELSVDEMADFLKDDIEPEKIDLTPPKIDSREIPKGKEKEEVEEEEEPEESDKEKDEEEDEDELKEIEDELEEPSEEKMVLMTPARRKEILKKYPEVFKDFPYLEVAYYRDQQFTNYFTTPAEAKEAVEAKEVLQNFERDVMQGNTESILRAIKEQDENAFNHVADEYLNTLAKVDDKAYFHVIGNVTRHTIYGMVQEAHRLGIGTAENPGPGSILQQAAQILNQYAFGTSAYTPPSKLSKEAKPEDNARERAILEREQQFTRQQFEHSRNDLNVRINRKIENTISEYIDPKNTMSDYVRKHAEADALRMLEGLLNKDERFISLKDKLWEKVFESNFSKEYVDKIDQAYTAKAKALLPSVIKKARNDAWRGMGKRVRSEESESVESGRKNGPIKGGQPHSPERKGGRITNAKDIPRGMSSLEFLNSD